MSFSTDKISIRQSHIWQRIIMYKSTFLRNEIIFFSDNGKIQIIRIFVYFADSFGTLTLECHLQPCYRGLQRCFLCMAFSNSPKLDNTQIQWQILTKQQIIGKILPCRWHARGGRALSFKGRARVGQIWGQLWRRSISGHQWPNLLYYGFGKNFIGRKGKWTCTEICVA